jgi:hypothetical protein
MPGALCGRRAGAARLQRERRRDKELLGVPLASLDSFAMPPTPTPTPTCPCLAARRRPPPSRSPPQRAGCSQRRPPLQRTLVVQVMMEHHTSKGLSFV